MVHWNSLDLSKDIRKVVPGKSKVSEFSKSGLIYIIVECFLKFLFTTSSLTVCSVPRLFTIFVKKLLNSSAAFSCFELKYLGRGEWGVGVAVVVLSVRKGFTVSQNSLLLVIFLIFSLMHFCSLILFYMLLNFYRIFWGIFCFLVLTFP